MTKSATRVAADKATFTQAEVTAKDTAARAGRKNLILNGGMQISQRGDYSSLSYVGSVYTLDRWMINNSTALGSIQHKAGYPYTNDKYMRVECTTAGTGYIRLLQKFEGDALKGKTVTLSAMVKSNSASARLMTTANAVWESNDGTAKHTGGGSWEKLSFTTTGTNGAVNPYFQIALAGVGHGNIAVGLGDYFEIANVQLEVGSVATDFEHRSYGEELADCQRYYWRAYDTYSLQGTRWFNEYFVTVVYPTDMRTTPTFTKSRAEVFTALSSAQVVQVSTNAIVNNPSKQSCELAVTCANVGVSAAVRLTANTDWFALDAEL
tara:strand:+ start:1444 stop:2409 length:966 start_codon:yes stop_codon:yes gene_type:complete